MSLVGVVPAIKCITMEKMLPNFIRRKVSSVSPAVEVSPAAERSSTEDASGTVNQMQSSLAVDKRATNSYSLLSPHSSYQVDSRGHSLSGSFSLFHSHRFSSGRKVEQKESSSEASDRPAKGKTKKKSTVVPPTSKPSTPEESLTLDM